MPVHRRSASRHCWSGSSARPLFFVSRFFNVRPSAALAQAGAGNSSRELSSATSSNTSTKEIFLFAFVRAYRDALLHFDIFGIMKSNDAVESLAALAQVSRLSIFPMLVKRGPEGYTPTQLGQQLNVSSPTLSFHHKELQRAGLVDVRRDGRFPVATPLT